MLEKNGFSPEFLADAPAAAPQMNATGTMKVSAVDVQPNAQDVPVTGHLTFLGDSGEALTGKEADLLAPLTKGCPNYVPAVITATVGKKCTVIAEVDQETYDADPGIVFLTVSKAQLITDSVPALGSSTHTSLAIANKAIVPAKDLESTQSRLPESCNSQTTPPKDIIEPTDADEEEDMGKTTKDKKRKNTNEKKGPACQGIIQREAVTLALPDSHHRIASRTSEPSRKSKKSIKHPAADKASHQSANLPY